MTDPETPAPSPPARPPAGAASRAEEVLRAVHAEPGITRAHLARSLGMSTGVAADTVRRLIDRRLLAEAPSPATGARGRPTRSLGPHEDGPLVLAAAIAHEAWQVAAVQLGGSVLESVAGRHTREREAVLSAVAHAISDVADRHGPRIRSIAVSVPGTVSGTRLVQAPNLGWTGVDLASLRPSGAAAVPFVAGNDATLAALAEGRRGAARGAGSFLHLYMDSGVGGALVDDDRLVLGAHGRAGEFGHMPLGRPDRRCRCGALGCWNTDLDGHALARALARPAPDDEVTFSRQVLGAARAGAPAEQRAVAAAAAAFGRGVAGLVNALDPELVTIGGLAVALVELGGGAVARAYREGLMATLADRPPPLRAGELADRAPLTGAADRAFDLVLAELAAA